MAREDNAETLYARLKETAMRQVENFTPKLASGDFSRVPQNHAIASSWRKRTKADGRIDWRMPAEGIYNLVRALTDPYPGTHIELEGSETKVWSCEVLNQCYPRVDLWNVEPGRVLMAGAKGVDVRCADGVVRLTKHEFQTLPLTGTFL